MTTDAGGGGGGGAGRDPDLADLERAGPFELGVTSFLSTDLHPRAFAEFWISSGVGAPDRCLTVVPGPATAAAGPRVLRSTRRPLERPDPHAVYDDLADRARVLVSVRWGAAAATTTVAVPLPPAPLSPRAALCVDLYGVERGDAGDGVVAPAPAYRRCATATFFLDELIGAAAAGGAATTSAATTHPLLDWAAVESPHVTVDNDPPVRGWVVLTRRGAAAPAGTRFAPRREWIAEAERAFSEQARAALAEHAAGGWRRAMRGVTSLPPEERGAADPQGPWPHGCTQIHSLSPFWCDGRDSCRLPGGAVLGWVGDRSGVHPAFDADEAWFGRQLACVALERGAAEGAALPAALPAAAPTLDEATAAAEACVLWCASQPYLPDRRDAVDPVTRRAVAVAGDTPTDPFVARGNCKDDARAACAVWVWLCSEMPDPKTAAVARARRAARCFAPAVCFGAARPFGGGEVQSHVVCLAIPLWRAALMLPAAAAQFDPAALAESRAFERVLALEGTGLFASDSERAPPTPWVVSVEAVLAGDERVWTRARRSFADPARAVYLMTTSATIPWAPAGSTRRWYFTRDGGETIGVPSRALFEGRGITMVPAPHTEFDADLLRRVRCNERRTRVRSAAASKDAEFYAPGGVGAELARRVGARLGPRDSDPAAAAAERVTAFVRCCDAAAAAPTLARARALASSACVWRGVNGCACVTLVR